MDSTIVVSIISGVVSPIVLLYVKYIIDKKAAKKPTDFINDAVKLGNLINQKLGIIKDHCGADRVWLMQFHNGGVFYPSGKSIAKFSMFYEVSDNDVEPLQSQFQNIPIFIYSNLIELIKHQKLVAVPITSTTTMNLIDSLLTPAKSKYYFAIQSAIDDRLIGVMGIDYIKTQKTMTDTELEEITNYAHSVGGLLTTHLQ